MNEVRGNTWCIRTLSPVLVALGLLGISASSAQAGGCNHRSHQVSASSSTSFTWLTEAGAVADTHATSAQPLRQDPNAPRPCSGPSCSGGSNSSLPPIPTAIFVVDFDQWAHFEPALPTPDLGSHLLLVGDSPRYPSPAADPLLQPPRRPFA